MRTSERPASTGPRTCGTPSVRPRRPRCACRRRRRPGRHDRAGRRRHEDCTRARFDTFRSLNTGRSGGSRTSGVVVDPTARARRHVATTAGRGARPPRHRRRRRWTASPIEARHAPGADGFVVEATGAGNTSAALLAAAERAMADGHPGRARLALPGRRRTPAYAFPGGGATWVRAGAILPAPGGPKARVAMALGSAPAWIATGSRACSPTRPDADPETAPPISPTTATLTGHAPRRPRHRPDRHARGDAGFGWVEAVGIPDGRVAFAGSGSYLETRADPFTAASSWIRTRSRSRG